jgi:hypothetical protein
VHTLESSLLVAKHFIFDRTRYVRVITGYIYINNCIDHRHCMQGAFDTKDGPQGWLPRPGFAAAVKEVQAAGVHIIPYTNGRVDDPNVPSFTADGAARYMCNGSVGPYREECVQ